MIRPLLCIFVFALTAMGVVQPNLAYAGGQRADEPALRAGAHRIVFDGWGGPALPVWTFIPAGIDPKTAPIVIVMHGARRDADRYRDQWVEPARSGGFIVVAPEFSKAAFPKANGYNLGGVFDAASGSLRKEDVWTFSAIEPVFDHVVARLGGSQQRYTIYGHSAGSQFVHRFLFFKPDARVKRYLAANAGWYTFADSQVEYPFGLGGIGYEAKMLKQALAKNLVIALGERDSDPDGRLLNKGAGAMRQGSHRFARGKAFYAAAKAYAERQGWEFGWSLRVVEGVAHSNGKMAPELADLIR